MLKAMLGLEKEKLFQSGKMLIPFVLLLGYLGLAYSVSPQKILPSFSICGLVIFLVLLSMGVINDDLRCPMIEQAQYVRIEKKRQIFEARILLIFVLSTLCAFLALLYPVIVQISNGGHYFTRQFRISDLISGFVLFFLCGAAGGVLGLFFNSRIFQKRRTPLALSVVFAIFTLIRESVCETVPAAKLIFWILPPVQNFCIQYAKREYFSLRNTGLSGLVLVLYICILCVVYIKMMEHMKFL